MQTPDQSQWRPLTIAITSWLIGIACWFAVIAADAMQIAIRTTALGRNEYQRPRHFGSILNSDIAVAVLYGACFFFGAFFVGRKRRNAKAPFYVFAVQCCAALLWFSVSLSHEIKSVELMILFIPTVLAPLASWLANTIHEKRA